MKIVIKEDKRDRLAKQLLTDEFSGMYEDVNYYTDSVGEKMRIEYRNGDGAVSYTHLTLPTKRIV